MDEGKGKIKNPWIKAMFVGFGSLALAIILFLFLYKFKVFAKGVKAVVSLLMPFIIGGALAYLLSPLCNKVEKWYNAKYNKTPIGEIIKDKKSFLCSVFCICSCIRQILSEWRIRSSQEM